MSPITRLARPAGIALLAAAATLLPAVPAAAIRSGEPDTAHPSVGLVRFTRSADGPLNDRGWCTGTLIADRVVMTAGHCLFEPDGQTYRDFFVSFNPKRLNNPLVDPTVAGDYLAGTAIADPRFAYTGRDRAFDHDRAVVILEGSAKAKWGIDPVPLPPLGFMDGVTHGHNRGQTFTMVGYGLDRLGSPGKPQLVLVDERRSTTVTLANTRDLTFCLHGNENSANAEGGGYFGDSGSTAFWGPYPYALGTMWGGTLGQGCYARTDTAGAREFLGRFVTLP